MLSARAPSRCSMASTSHRCWRWATTRISRDSGSWACWRTSAARLELAGQDLLAQAEQRPCHLRPVGLVDHGRASLFRAGFLYATVLRDLSCNRLRKHVQSIGYDRVRSALHTRRVLTKIGASPK